MKNEIRNNIRGAINARYPLIRVWTCNSAAILNGGTPSLLDQSDSEAQALGCAARWGAATCLALQGQFKA